MACSVSTSYPCQVGNSRSNPCGLLSKIQTVHRETNPLYHALLSAFHERTGCPVMVNTSFNVRGEPMVCTPGDAFLCFMGTEIEVLAVGNCISTRRSRMHSLSAVTSTRSRWIDLVWDSDEGNKHIIGLPIAKYERTISAMWPVSFLRRLSELGPRDE